ncbi:EmrB/QacA subfamily drug resistance transporter [Paenibacillus sp. BK033]|uniref:MDR family MFS transporter n=1 Tax=Paenibacillus sp. BK033 TaxID=2512133 RepID=UPI0010F1AFF6|nr:MDR family MFS transporter [Paenibacillus sp. BK033]TCM96998.1 EmrB/QacA subfamily drug resistance transporter [Paenibacillus sp. BK033]
MNAKQDGSRFWFVILAIFFGNFSSILNSGTVTVALPFMMKDLHSDLNDTQWVTTGFMLAMGSIAPIVGYLGDKISYKRLYMFSLVGFLLCSILCGCSWNIGSLVLFRILQGLFCGAILPATLTIVYQAVPAEKQALGVSLWSVASMFAPAIGPTLGGLLTEYYGWKAIFFMNIPLALLAIALASRYLPMQQANKGSSLDIAGLLTAVTGSTALMMYFTQGNKIGWFSGWGILWITLGVVSMALFVWRELTAKAPLLNLRIFQYTTFTFGIVVNCILTIGLYAGAFLLPIYMENALGSSSLTVGLMMLPGALLMIGASLLSGRLHGKIRPEYPLLGGAFLLIIATWAFSRLSLTTSYAFIIGWMICRYVGLGFSSPNIMTLSMSAIPKESTGHASAITNWLRQVIASFAIGIFSSVYSVRTQTHFTELSSSGAVNTSLQETASVLAMNDTFIAACIVTVVAIPFILVLSSRSRSSGNKAASTVSK